MTLNHHKKLYNPWSNAERIWNTGVHLYPPGTQTDVMNSPDEHLAAWPVPYSTVLPSMITNLLPKSQVSWEYMGFTSPEEESLCQQVDQTFMENFKTRFSGERRCRFEQQTKARGYQHIRKQQGNICEITWRNLGMFLSRGVRLIAQLEGLFLLMRAAQVMSRRRQKSLCN